MMRMTVLASGSKGNSAVVSSSQTRILVDAGLSCRELMKRMVSAGEDPHTLDAILITHEHADHVSGLPVLARKLGIPTYFTEQTHRAWQRQLTPRRTMTYAQWLEQRKAEISVRDETLAQQQTAHSYVDPSIENFIAGRIDLATAATEAVLPPVEDIFKTPFSAADEDDDTVSEEDLDSTGKSLKVSVRDNPSYL